MNNLTSQQRALAIQRITALWGFSECGLGGFLHAFHLPFSGLFVGGLSVFFITMISYFSDRIWRDLSLSLLVVLAVKLAVSPHSPITAYVAVAFQGLIGMLLFRFMGLNKGTIVTLAVVTFLESAFQKFLILTLLFGKSLWVALDIYGNAVARKIGTTLSVSSSAFVISIYSGIYLLGGVLMAILIIKIIPIIKEMDFSKTRVFVPTSSETMSTKKNKKRLVIATITLALIVLAFAFWGDGVHPLEKGIYLLVRSTLALLIYYLIVGPMLFYLLKKVLDKKSNVLSVHVDEAVMMIPYLRSIAKQAYQDAKIESGNTWKYFLAFLLMYTLQFEAEEEGARG